MLLVWLFLLLYCASLKFSDRDNTHQLFEYIFLESECENGLFQVHEFVSGVSFGSLSIGQAIQCIGRSGYRSLPLTTSYSFVSNQTFAAVYERIAQTKEFSIEMWLKVQNQSFILSQLLSVATVTSEVWDNNDVFSIQHFYDNIMFFLTETSTGPVSLVLYPVDSEPYVHVVLSVRFRQSGTDMRVGVLVECERSLSRMALSLSTVQFLQPITIYGIISIVCMDHLLEQMVHLFLDGMERCTI